MYFVFHYCNSFRSLPWLCISYIAVWWEVWKVDNDSFFCHNKTTWFYSRGRIFFPDFCHLCLRKFREFNEDHFRQELFKVLENTMFPIIESFIWLTGLAVPFPILLLFKILCGTDPHPLRFRAKKYRIQVNIIKLICHWHSTLRFTLSFFFCRTSRSAWLISIRWCLTYLSPCQIRSIELVQNNNLNRSVEKEMITLPLLRRYWRCSRWQIRTRTAGSTMRSSWSWSLQGRWLQTFMEIFILKR